MRTSFTLLSNLPLIVFGQTPPSSPAPATTLSGEERARSLLDESLKDKNPDTRKQAVQALGLVGPARIQNRSSFRTIVRPAKAGMFSGRQSHRGNSQDPVAWVAFAEETKRMKPTDKAILGMVSESPGRNASEPGGGLDRK
jgi:hypothetical protein